MRRYLNNLTLSLVGEIYGFPPHEITINENEG